MHINFSKGKIVKTGFFSTGLISIEYNYVLIISDIISVLFKRIIVTLVNHMGMLN